MFFMLLLSLFQNPIPPGPPLQEFRGSILAASAESQIILLKSSDYLYVLKFNNDKLRKEALSLRGQDVKVTGRLYPASGPVGGPRREKISSIQVEKIEAQEDGIKEQWSAFVNFQPVVPKAGPPLVVRGSDIEVATGSKLELEVAKPQGVNNKVLLLNLKVVQQGDPLPGVTKVNVTFSVPYSGGWRSVTIRYPNGGLVTVRVLRAD